MLDGQIIVELNEDWKPEGLCHNLSLKAPSSLSTSKPSKKIPLHLKPTIIFTPTAQEFAQEVGSHQKPPPPHHARPRTGPRLRLHPQPKERLDAQRSSTSPTTSAVTIDTTNTSDDHFFLETHRLPHPIVAPARRRCHQRRSNPPRPCPPQFDASNLVVEQLQATSNDGTKVPYFVVHRKDIKYDGSNPTLMTAYGGFQVSETPRYSGIIGKLWLERGGVYVLANIRGGGEFGPAWHEAGLKTHRQRIYDDFASVAKDLFARKITSPRRLGI